MTYVILAQPLDPKNPDAKPFQVGGIYTDAVTVDEDVAKLTRLSRSPSYPLHAHQIFAVSR